MPTSVTGPATSRFRWYICALLFAGTAINYVDRQALALLEPILDRELGWTNEQFGVVSSSPLYGAIVLIGIACGSHQAFSANLYALTADLFPRRAVAAVAEMK